MKYYEVKEELKKCQQKNDELTNEINNLNKKIEKDKDEYKTLEQVWN